jgi:hydroxymethylglutaryl-CoA synthase
VNRIAAGAGYVPRYVLTRAAAQEAWPRVPMPIRSRAVPALDEDPITMAVQAAERALDRAGIGGGDLSAIFLATSSSPYVVKSGAAIVADYLGARDSVCLVDSGAGSHAGLQALLAALRDESLARRGPILVIGADALFGEPGDPGDFVLGAGAAALVVAPEGFAALEAYDQHYSSFSNVWQVAGERHLSRYDDDRFDRAAGYPAQMAAGLRGFVAGLEGSPDWYALQLSGGGDGGLSKLDGAHADQLVGGDLAAAAGDAGCANCLLNLVVALDRAAPGEVVVVQAYGAGAGTVTAALRAESAAPPGAGALPADDPVELSYVQYAKHRGLLPMPGVPAFGAPFAASPQQERTKAQTIGLRAGRCVACRSLNFPQRAYCLDCRGQEFETTPLPRRAAVATFNLQYVVGIGPEQAPLPICTAVLDGEPADRYGGKIAALICDAEPEQVRIGMPVALVARRGDAEQGMVQYGWKLRPVAEAAA